MMRVFFYVFILIDIFIFSLHLLNTRRAFCRRLRMADDTNNDFSPREPGPIWSGVFITEFILIFVINALTITVFSRNRHLRKRTTYLIINLTVADLLVGGVSGPLGICRLKYKIQDGHGFSWQEFCILTFFFLFPGSSLVNLSLNSLERLHAALYPFRHCLIEKWVYFKAIICCWLLALINSSLVAVIYLFEPVENLYLLILASHVVITLLILIISYVIIIVKVRSNPPPQNFGALASDRKLSVTLFMVTVVSVLAILPWAICAVILVTTWSQQSSTRLINTETPAVLFYANSMVNPCIYAIRMQEFRKALKDLVYKKTPDSTRAQPIEQLHSM